jgi:CRISPR-associated protein Cst2
MRFAVGMVLVDAPHSALNMAGLGEGTEQNKVVVKKFRRGRYEYPYVSAQAWRYWWRNTLEDHFGWVLSGLTKVEGKSQAYTAANPIEYPDDDIFGYMRALGNNQTVTRISPLKTTPLVSILPTLNSVSSDFGVFSRQEGDPVPYEQQFYSTILKGAFSLDLDAVGKFSLVDRAGYRNIIKPEGKGKKAKESQDEYNRMLEAAERLGATIGESEWTLPSNIRKKRASDVIQALKYIYGGAKQTLFLTDVTPKFVVFAMFDGGINPFISDIIWEDRGEVKLDVVTLASRVNQYKDILNPKRIIIGKDGGFFSEWDEQLKTLPDKINSDGETVEVIIDSVVNAIESFAKEVEAYYESA